MPTVLRVGPYRLHFYSNEGDEPPHIHVQRDDDGASFWLDPVELKRNNGFSGPELGIIQRIVEQYENEILQAWHDYFGSSS
jgi:hypothetical protein